MLNTLIVGASGYAGAELVTYVNRHPHHCFALKQSKRLCSYADG
ncbi:hypothetical protein ACUODJ_48265, partial [Escherichia sp. HC-CC]